MQLVPVYSETLVQSGGGASSDTDGTVNLGTASQQMYGVRLATVKTSEGGDSIRVFGRVTADETKVFHVNLGTDGYVKETKDDAAGNWVKKDQHLALVYSPDFLAVTGGYLSANERTPIGNSKDAAPSAQNAASAQARADRLRNLGMSDVQIEEVSKTRKIPEDIYVVSPVDGFILTRNISAGQRFERNVDFYTIADLSRVWVVAEVFGSDANAFRPGTMVHVTVPGTDEKFEAHVANVLPQVDAATHTLQVRIEVNNTGFKLRPDMFVDVELPKKESAGLVIPSDSVIDSGTVKRVFVQTAEGRFTPRAIETGWRSGDMVEVTQGLHEGEIVVSEGSFLIDSESRLRRSSVSDKIAESSTPSELTPNTTPEAAHP